jgi:hypothetical protein
MQTTPKQAATRIEERCGRMAWGGLCLSKKGQRGGLNQSPYLEWALRPRQKRSSFWLTPAGEWRGPTNC